MKKMFFINMVLFFIVSNTNAAFSEEKKYHSEFEFGTSTAEKTLQFNGNGRVNITGYNGNKILISSNEDIFGNEDSKTNEKAKGLTKIGGGGFNIIRDKEKNIIIITRPIEKNIDLDVQVPNNITLKFGNETNNQISGELLLGIGQNEITILNSLLNGKEIPEEALREGGLGPNEIEIVKNLLGEKEKELRNLKEKLQEKSNKNEMGIQIPQLPQVLYERIPSAPGLMTLPNISNGIFSGDISIKNFSGIVEASIEKGNITAENMDGQIIASTVEGEINITFRNINKDKTLYFTTVNGDIDITFPKDINAYVMSSAAQGDIYSGFAGDVVIGDESANEKRRIGSQNPYHITLPSNYITTKINNGGQKIYLNTMTGNIYIRKGS